MKINLEQFRDALEPPVNRRVLTALIMSNKVIAPQYRAAIGIMLSTMRQEELNRLGGLAQEALEFIITKDTIALEQYLTDKGLPGNIIKVIMSYASDSPSE